MTRAKLHIWRHFTRALWRENSTGETAVYVQYSSKATEALLSMWTLAYSFYSQRHIRWAKSHWFVKEGCA